MENSNPNPNPHPHVALVVSPGMGHSIPLLELSKHLLTKQTIHSTIFLIKDELSTTQFHFPQSQLLPKELNIIELPPPNISSLITPHTTLMTRLCILIKQSLPALRSAITAMHAPPAALIVDLFCSDAFDIADELNIPKILYLTYSAKSLALIMYLPILDKEIEGEFINLKEPIHVPSCKPIDPVDLFEGMQDRKNEQYSLLLQTSCRYQRADGILVNTWEDLEPTSLKALRFDDNLRQITIPPIYPVGPIVKSVGNSITRCECLEWLDKQPPESVLFVSFGSSATISTQQLSELAWGLELSQQRFIWVVRPPLPRKEKELDDLSEFLPDGFLTRTHKVGLVVPHWAPQVEILAHSSTGGFLSHCGWNSTLESIVNGVPMIAWPLFAEQNMNASMLSEDLGVAVRIKFVDGIVGREEIERLVRLIMMMEEGKKLRVKVNELKITGLKALSEGGSSFNALTHVAREWKCAISGEKTTRI